jgi:hypothetical protein
MQMKKLFLIVAFILAGYIGFNHYVSSSNVTPVESSSQLLRSNDEAFGRAFKNHANNLQIGGSGTVLKILPDDTTGSQHQKFIVQLGSGQTLLIAHNIDLAPRIDSLTVGDHIKFHGVYEWNAQGGVVHWTHRYPSGSHIAGWIEHHGEKYQ